MVSDNSVVQLPFTILKHLSVIWFCFSFDIFGQVLVTGSNDGHVFVQDPRVTSDFKVLGHTGKNVSWSILIFQVICN